MDIFAYISVAGLTPITVIYLATKYPYLGKIMQNNGHYAFQGHSRSPISVPAESLYETHTCE